MNQNNIKKCDICYETLSHILFNCGHEICKNVFLIQINVFIDVNNSIKYIINIFNLFTYFFITIIK